MGQAFTTPLDIGNRALQHLGATRASTWTEQSKNASEVRFIYDKSRQAELRRNQWVFSTRHAILRPVDVDTLLVAPDAWSSTSSYPSGSIVSHLGSLWWTDIPVSVGDTPGTSDAWQSYFGPLTASPWDEDTTYYTGDLVYLTDAYGRTTVYYARTGDNTDDPTDTTDWDTTVSYGLANVVKRSGFYYYSLVSINLGNDPLDSPSPYNSETTYAADDTVGAIDGFIYTSVVSGNIGFEPSTDDGSHWVTDGLPLIWTPGFSSHFGAISWTPVPATVTNLVIAYPIGTGPYSNAQTRNVYRLPNGWLKEARQNPREGTYAWLGAPSAPWPSDWTYEGQYLITGAPTSNGVIVYRFIADVTNVVRMDPMFCEGLAARMALDLCETITQSNSKKSSLGVFYEQYMGEARIVNAIEVGTIVPDEDTYITCRQ